ncbi:chemotaxis protein CheA [Sporichthya polymorpha]|uniref:chemotaxis protein CheA n=1 Tax=Sporichthya polymorpha TaxID=35751 RepID=UPI00039ABB6D|nr:chemotaxis protein CheA [Sporichthya polymorpha]
MSDRPVFADGLDDIAQEFLIESYENLDELDRALVALEREPDSQPLLASVFRTIHTIKGTSGFLAFNRLEAVTHVGENVLSKLRDGELALTPQITTVLLQMVDTVRALLASIETTGVEGDIDVEAVSAALAGCLEPAPLVPAPRDEVEPAPAPVAEAAPDPAPEPEPAPEPVLSFETAALGNAPMDTADHDEEHARRSVADSSIRVDVGLLDQLMRMVGELVLTRNQVVQYVGETQHTELQRASQRLNLIATELQEGVMKTRMQPIDQVWSRLPRVVRDLGAQCGKSVRLVMEGRETELDRTLLEAVKDPLTHLVRNAIDHGLEAPEVRTAAGKPAEGTLSLRAYHEGGQVVVEVGDDGRGIDPAKVAAKAIENGLVSRDQLSRMSEREIADLVFRPGFSTAAAVSNISGRGVGMDVVRTNIEKIGGTVDLASEIGVGTTVRVRIPLTLAIIPALVVGQAGDTYAIPQANLLELVRLEGEAATSGIEHVAGAPVYRLRGTLLPLVYLDEQLGLPAPAEREALNIVVLAADNTHFGLVVEEIRDTQEIVVRPLSRQIKHVEAFAGATITGDGKVALILDVAGIAQRATHQTVAATAARMTETERGRTTETTRLLICQVGADRRLALPMTDVARLEEFGVDQVEKAGNADVVQYRGDLLRLVHVGPLLGMGSAKSDAETYSVVVHRHENDAAVGLVVDSILDVIEEEVVLSAVGARRGLAGSAVLQSRVTDIVDVPALVAATQEN